MPCYPVFESWNPLTPIPQVISHYNYSLSCSYSYVKHLQKYPSLWKAPYIYEYLSYKRTYIYSLKVVVWQGNLCLLRATLDEVSNNKKWQIEAKLKWPHFGRKINWFQPKKKLEKKKKKASYKRRAHDLKTQDAS